MTLPPRYQDKLEEWLIINREQWEHLQSFGVEDGTELNLDYSYSAEDENSARLFAQSFDQRFGHNSTVQFLEADDDGSPAIWAIFGTTAPTASSLSWLDSWVKELVAFGAEYGCLFEGWGTYPPEAGSPESGPRVSLGLGSFQLDDAVREKFPALLYFYIPLPVQPVDRGEQFDDPLSAMLEAEDLGRLLRSGSVLDMASAGVSIAGFEMVVCVAEPERAAAAIRNFLVSCGAPPTLEVEERNEDPVVR